MGRGKKKSLIDRDWEACRGERGTSNRGDYERILEINALQEVTKTVVEAARESLVIGQA